MKGYVTILEPGEHNWSAYVPDLPGCVAAAETRQLTEARIGEAIMFHLEGMREDGEQIPEPRAEVGKEVMAAF